VDVDDPKAPAAESLGVPDLVVLAEGGKSTSVRTLGLDSVRFSYAKYFMSAHVDLPFGPRTRRVDSTVRALTRGRCASPAAVSLWACGHGDPKQGTWIVLEVPEDLIAQSPDQALEYFADGAAMLLGGDAEAVRRAVRASVGSGNQLTSSRRAGAGPDGAASGSGTPFAGTFKFEQQCLRRPAVGANVVVLGDSAGMGHHALSSGLEMGACDLGPLRRLAAELAEGREACEAVSRYADRVFRSRLTLLSLGMREYYPQLEVDPIDLLHRAADIADERGVVGACEAFEALLADLDRRDEAEAESERAIAA